MAPVDAVYSREDSQVKLRRSGTVTIGSGTALSDAYLSYMASEVALQMPAVWTAAVVTFQVQASPSAAFAELQNRDGTDVTYTLAGAEAANIPELAGWYAFKVRSGTSGVPVNQAAGRTVHLNAWDR